MALYIIGIGLGNEEDITLKGLNVVKECDVVFLEHYTSILGVDKGRLEALYEKEIILAPRDLVEREAEEKILKPAKEQNVAFLVVGDAFGATTHADLLLRAQEENIPVRVIHNAGIMNAVGVVGLELYKYGKTTSIPFWTQGFEPETPYHIIKENLAIGAHTLCLLDIKVSEPSKEDLLAGRAPKEVQPRFMTVKEGISILEKIEQKHNQEIILPETQVIGVARIGQKDQKIIVGTCKELKNIDFGAPLHALIVPGPLQIVEQEMLEIHENK